MASSIAKVSSAALTELQSDLTSLSSTLHKIYELMNADMRQVNVAWQDAKYQEFVQNYQPKIQKCEDIANRYSEWCKRVLDPTIENVTAVETIDVSGDSAGSVGSSNVANAAAAGGAAAAGTGIISGFNMGDEKTISTNPNADLDAHCSPGYHAQPTTENEKHFSIRKEVSHSDPTYHAELEGKGGAEADASESWLAQKLGINGKVSAELSGKVSRDSSKETTKTSFEGYYKCVEDKKE